MKGGIGIDLCPPVIEIACARDVDVFVRYGWRIGFCGMCVRHMLLLWAWRWRGSTGRPLRRASVSFSAVGHGFESVSRVAVSPSLKSAPVTSRPLTNSIHLEQRLVLSKILRVRSLSRRSANSKAK